MKLQISPQIHEEEKQYLQTKIQHLEQQIAACKRRLQDPNQTSITWYININITAHMEVNTYGNK